MSAAGDRAPFRLNTTLGASGTSNVSGTPKQTDSADYAKIFATSWTVAALEILDSPTEDETWNLYIEDSDTTIDTNSSSGSYTPPRASYKVKGAAQLKDGITALEDLTTSLSDRIPAEFLPIVSGYTVTFDAQWPSEATSTLVFSPEPKAGETWIVSMDIAGTVVEFSHLVLESETVAEIAQALADVVNAEETDHVSNSYWP